MASVRMLMVAAVAVVLTTGGTAWAGAPTDQLRGRVDRVLRLLEDPQLKSEARAGERRASIRAIVAEIFDFRELSQRALGPHWQGRTPSEQATVRTRIVTKQSTEIPVDYRMRVVGDRWLVYDVAIEGVSLVANYRAQFNRIIQRSSYKGLVEQLTARLASQR